MEITHKKLDAKAVLLKLHGELNIETVEMLNQEIGYFLARERCFFILDCKLLDILTSAALLQMLYVQEHIKDHGGDLLLCHVNKRSARIFDFPGLECHLLQFSDLAAAERHLRSIPS